jgi:hypothetical protein
MAIWAERKEDVGKPIANRAEDVKSFGLVAPLVRKTRLLVSETRGNSSELSCKPVGFANLHYQEQLTFGSKLYRFEDRSVEPRRLRPIGAEKLVALPMVTGVSDLLTRYGGLGSKPPGCSGRPSRPLSTRLLAFPPANRAAHAARSSSVA